MWRWASCARFSGAVYPAGALHVIDGYVDAAGIEGGSPPLGSDPGIWVTQPLALTREENKNGVGQSRGPSGFVLFNTALKFAAFTCVSDYGDVLRMLH